MTVNRASTFYNKNEYEKTGNKSYDLDLEIDLLFRELTT